LPILVNSIENSPIPRVWQGFCCNSNDLQILMKQFFLFLGVVASLLVSCKKEVQPFTQNEIQKKVDSIVSIRILEMDERATRDLNFRMKIEVKAKADSIVSANIARRTADTVHHSLKK
jgi:hypothetical protein